MNEIKIDKISCVEKIAKLFRYDTIVLLDCVLTDDLQNPEYSANTVYDRISCLLDFENEFYIKNIKDVWQWLIVNGYSEADAELLKRKMNEENIRYKA